MALDIDTVNAALAHLGEDATATLSVDSVRTNVRKVLNHLERARDAVLGRHGWVAALEYSTLERADEAGDFRYGHRFWLPTAALRVWTVALAGSDSEPRWSSGTRLVGGDERRVIRCDSEGPLDVSWVRRIGWAMIPGYLDLPLGLQLAAFSCVAVNGDAQRALGLQKLANEALALAIGTDGTQEGGQPTPFGGGALAALRAAAG